MCFIDHLFGYPPSNNHGSGRHGWKDQPWLYYHSAIHFHEDRFFGRVSSSQTCSLSPTTVLTCAAPCSPTFSTQLTKPLRGGGREEEAHLESRRRLSEKAKGMDCANQTHVTHYEYGHMAFMYGI